MNWNMSRRIMIALGVLFLGQRLMAKEYHHIYKSGDPPDACHPEDFPKSYWTRSDHGVSGFALVGTAYAQRIIWEHQNPSDCGAVKYLIWVSTYSGIGSNVHSLGQALAYALAFDRVLLIARQESHPYYDASFCGNAPSWFDCYFEPLSTCTLSDAASALGVDTLDHETLVAVPDAAIKNAHLRPSEQVVKFTGNAFSHHDAQTLPPIFDKFLSTSAVDPSKYHYWWRAQSVAFLVRPNAKALASMEKQKSVLFPQSVAKGTISCHIRHGDKWLETGLLDDAVYVATLDHLFKKASGEGVHLARKVFLSTEDPKSVEYFSHLQNWETGYLDIPRKPDHTKTTIEYAQELGPANDTLNSLLNLDLALQCDAWVGTLSSNWCRLIDELRSTVRCKARGIYWDAEQKNPPSNLFWKK